MTASELRPATDVADLEQLYRDLHANPEFLHALRERTYDKHGN